MHVQRERDKEREELLRLENRKLMFSKPGELQALVFKHLRVTGVKTDTRREQEDHTWVTPDLDIEKLFCLP